MGWFWGLAVGEFWGIYTFVFSVIGRLMTLVGRVDSVPRGMSLDVCVG